MKDRGQFGVSSSWTIRCQFIMDNSVSVHHYCFPCIKSVSWIHGKTSTGSLGEPRGALGSDRGASGRVDLGGCPPRSTRPARSKGGPKSKCLARVKITRTSAGPPSLTISDPSRFPARVPLSRSSRFPAFAEPNIGPVPLSRTSPAFADQCLFGPGRPGWLPTQVPHRSGLAHDAHPVPHLMNSRPARSVVGTWTWFRSRCTCQVSLQRLMRRHPLPLTGSLGLVPPLQRYYEMLRLPAAHFAALRFLRLAIPSLRPWFVPPGPGRGAVDQSGVGRRYLQPPCSMETTGSPKFPEEPL